MKQTFLYIIIILGFCSCKNQGKELEKTPVIEQKDSIRIEKSQISEKPSPEIESKSITDFPEIGKAYVTAESGLAYREKPDLNSTKLGTFDFGTELAIIEKTGIEFEVKEEGKNLKGEWVKVKSKIDRSVKNFRISRNYKYSGYVFNGFLVDSVNADFSQIPIQANYNNFPSIILEEQRNSLDMSFEPIAKSDFESYKRNYDSKIVQDSTMKAVPGEYFLLKTSNSYFKLICSNDYKRCYDFKGFLKPLNAYIIGFTGQGIGEIFLVDKESDKSLFLGGPYDDGGGTPLISPKNDKILTFASTIFKKESYIGIYDLNEGNRITDTQSSRSFITDEWRIWGVVWIDNKSLALQVYDKTERENGRPVLKNERFLKATLE